MDREGIEKAGKTDRDPLCGDVQLFPPFCFEKTATSSTNARTNYAISPRFDSRHLDG
jgi:hypothetical protein